MKDIANNHLVLVVDDVVDNTTLLRAFLRTGGIKAITASDGIEALKIVAEHKPDKPDLIILDINMPRMSGIEVCKKIKMEEETKLIPIILATGLSGTEDIVKGFEVGADDYVTKPYNYMEMMARVRSMLRIRDTQQELSLVNRKLDELNQNLEKKVQEQVGELERVNRLRRFLSPEIAKRITMDDADDILSEHRREITVVFLDLRNYTTFSEHATPQEVIRTLREFHQLVGPIIFHHRGTLERFTGDGMMVFLGDPEPMENHPSQSVKMAIDIMGNVEKLRENWAKKGYDLALGIGIATGEASLGTIGFSGRRDYAAIGAVTNLSARICSKANGGQILISDGTYQKTKDSFSTQLQGNIKLKGFSRIQPIYEVLRKDGLLCNGEYVISH